MAIVNLQIEVPDATSGCDLARLRERLTELAQSLLPAVERGGRVYGLSDSQLEEALSLEPSFDECSHLELTDEQFEYIAHTNRPLPEGVDRWL